MGKRKRDDPEYIKKKIIRLERKLRRKEETSPVVLSAVPIPSNVQNSMPPELSPLIPALPTPSAPDLVTEDNHEEPGLTTTENTDDLLSEEFLQALGDEGDEKEEYGEEIRNELSLRWTNIMAEGLKKDQKEALLIKYPTPKNFQAAVAPILNKEISATLSELSLNRDKRIVIRQNMMGKIMSCLGKSLTEILKGNINSKKLVEEINDAAKITAELHHTETKSRKFFALSSATKAIQETCRETKPAKFLFGDNLNEQLKAIQSVKRTAAQIKVPENGRPPTANTTKPLNWRSPSHYQLSQRGRGGHQATRRPMARQPPRRAPPSRGTFKQASRRANRRY